jgi:phosphate transport system permease protein
MVFDPGRSAARAEIGASPATIARGIAIIGALTFVAFVPHDSIIALPNPIFNWASCPQQAFHENAAVAILVLLAVLLVRNSAAVFLRQRHHRRLRG